MIISWVKDFGHLDCHQDQHGFMPTKLLTFIISGLVDYFWRANAIIKMLIISVVISTLVFINLPPQHHAHTSLHHLSSVDCRAAAPVLVWPSDCGLPTIILNSINMAGKKEVSDSIIMGPGVVETITINHSISPQQRTTEGVRMASTSPRDNQQTLLPSGSPATLAPPSAPPSAADHGGEATHQWIPAGMGAPVDPDDING
eukprot:878999-Amphidinium_carterae.1